MTDDLKFMKKVFYLITLKLILICSVVLAQKLDSNEPLPKLLTAREQTVVREEWLKTRSDTILLPLMRKHKIGMWIITNEEFHHDPLTAYIAPPTLNYVGRLEFFIFADRGTSELERIAVARFPDEHLKKFFQIPSIPGRNLKAFLKKLVEERNPQSIALNFGGNRGASSGITHDAYQLLAESVGDEFSKRFVPASALITEFLDTRLPSELEHYRSATGITDILLHRALSNEVIKPGKTTVGEVRWWLIQQVKNLGLELWYLPDFRIQRQGKSSDKMQHMFTLAEDAEVIERGDLIHIDYGIDYMGLSTDWQRHAYVLKKGEKDAPEGLKKALKNTNTIQDLIIKIARPGMGGAEVFAQVMAEAKTLGIDALIYSHSIGNQGHGLATGIEGGKFTGAESERLREGSYLAMELNTTTSISEWNNQKATIMLEDDVHLTKDGYQLFRPRQTGLYLIK